MKHSHPPLMADDVVSVLVADAKRMLTAVHVVKKKMEEQ